MNYKNDIAQCIKILQSGGIILYPTDTVWGLGCNAENEQAVSKVFKIKHRTETKSMIILLANEMEISKYVANPDPQILIYTSSALKPVTAIYQNGKNVASNLLNSDGSIAIRITKDEFCNALIKTFRKPLVSTSANLSGEAAPAIFSEISTEIKSGVDYIVQHRQGDFRVTKPSTIIRLNEERKIEVIRS